AAGERRRKRKPGDGRAHLQLHPPLRRGAGVSRSLTAATAEAARADVAYPVYFVEMHFRSETSRAWTGVGSIAWNGETWQGTGQFGRVSAIEETTELRIAGITLELSGVDPALIAAAMDRSEYKRREGAVWMGFTNQSG